MTLNDWLGVYGASLSTLLAIGQAVSAWRKRKSRITVDATLVDMGRPDQWSERKTTLLVRITNRSDYPVKVSSLGLEFVKGKGLAFLDGLPREIPPHDRIDAPLPYDELAGRYDFSKRFVAYASLTTGEKFQSKRIMLKKGVLTKSPSPPALKGGPPPP
jgi:hypothetical protein